MNNKEKNKFHIIDSVSSTVGSLWFLIIHVLWFSLWLILNMKIELLIMIVSLEAIILMILLLMDQNRQVMRDNLRDEKDLQADLKSVKLGKKILEEVEEIKSNLVDRNLEK